MNKNNNILLPLFPWVGGKRRLAPLIKKRMPDSYNNYYELFVGAGGLFFHINKPGGTITDVNDDIITTYEVVRDDPYGLMAELDIHLANQSRDYFRKICKEFSKPRSKTKQAAMMIYLIKACFGSMYKKNKKGEFNPGYKGTSFKTIYKKDHILRCSELLNNTTILNKSYKEVLPCCGDFVYLDPPYDMEHACQYNDYTPEKFLRPQQKELRDYCDMLTDRGVRFLMSNSNTEYVRSLYAKYNIEYVTNHRYISSGHTVTPSFTKELLITNY